MFPNPYFSTLPQNVCCYVWQHSLAASIEQDDEYYVLLEEKSRDFWLEKYKNSTLDKNEINIFDHLYFS